MRRSSVLSKNNLLLAACCCQAVGAFVPTTPLTGVRPSTVRPLGMIEPFSAVEAAATVSDSMFKSSLFLADTAVVADPAVADAAAEASSSGWFGFLTLPIQGLLEIIHTGIAGLGTPNAWGISIIVLTLLIKVVTFPLTKTQLESTNKMQAMQPAIKEIQSKYQSNPEVMNQKMAEFYQVNEINPLAGCLPSLVQIPVFIGLYRAVLDLAKANRLDEAFLFLPNLEGPTYGADPSSATDWLLSGWVDGVPSLGWTDTISFLILPVFLVVSQFVTMELMQPKSDDPAQQQSNIILKVLPLMIGWFALSVPAALSIYWVTNNLVTTGTSLWIKNSMQIDPPKPSGGGTATMEAPSSIFAPPAREKPVGFASTATSSNDVKPITAIDAEVVEVEGDNDDDDDDEMPKPKSKKRRKVKKKKRN